MEYNASATKHLFWFMETRKTARLLGNHSMDEVRQIVIEENLYQQKSDSRLINEFGCIRKRLEALPEKLQRMMVTADINTGKLIAFVGCMAADKLLFDLMYDVYRRKIYLGEPTLTDADLNIFFTRIQNMIENVLKNADYAINTSTSAVDKAQATRKRDKYIKQLAEIRAYYPALSHVALQRIDVDLDDGVKANYAKFQGIEVSIEGEKKQKVDLLAKI